MRIDDFLSRFGRNISVTRKRNASTDSYGDKQYNTSIESVETYVETISTGAEGGTEMEGKYDVGSKNLFFRSSVEVDERDIFYIDGSNYELVDSRKFHDGDSFSYIKTIVRKRK